MRIPIDNGEVVDTDTCDSDKLRSYAFSLDASADSIEHALQTAAMQRQSGQKINETWFVNASFAVKRKRKQANLLYYLASQQAKQAHIASSNRENLAFTEVFIKTCRATLKARGLDALFDNIYETAQYNYQVAQAEQDD